MHINICVKFCIILNFDNYNIIFSFYDATNNEYLSLIIFLLLHLISFISPFLNHLLFGFEPNTNDISSNDMQLFILSLLCVLIIFLN